MGDGTGKLYNKKQRTVAQHASANLTHGIRTAQIVILAGQILLLSLKILVTFQHSFHIQVKVIKNRS